MRVGLLSICALLGFATFAGCISNEDIGQSDDGAIQVPLGYTLPETITGMEELLNVDFSTVGGEDFRLSGNGIWPHDDLLYVSGSAFAIVDISNASDPVPLSVMDQLRVRDVDIMEHADGNTYAIVAGTYTIDDENRTSGVGIINVTDPRAPEVAGWVQIGLHNIVVVPGTSIVYNSRSLYTGERVSALDQAPVSPNAGPQLVTEGGLVDIIDFADPAEPVVSEFRFPKVAMTVSGPKPVTAPACHDISVYPEADRAYCAGVTETQVWDISEPAKPSIIQVVTNPGTNIHHAAYAARDHSLLIIGDELGGAALSPGCTVPDQAYGGVWFVDISDLATPIPVGWWAPEQAHDHPVVLDPGASNPSNALRVPTCTAHFGNFIEDRDLMVMGFYTAGVFIVDFSDPSDPVEVANHRPGGSVWEGRYHRGHVYTGDMGRGVDVLKLVGEGEEWISLEGVDDSA